mmetsp:Transcript_19619/g.46052  ORF Transcript_19619/g.46052 Transcript_19619/m.46052 type:complete len:252 (-) Transcript_19619:46-801(-)
MRASATLAILFAATVRLNHSFAPSDPSLLALSRLASRQAARHPAGLRSSPNDLFDAEGWQSIKSELDECPVFAVADDEGNPIKYTIERGGVSKSVPLFYTHVEDAQLELQKAKEKNLIPGIDLNPYPLGEIFQMWAKDDAVLVPNKASIVNAGAPPNAVAIGQQVPLFGCMEIANESEDGKPVLPLFLELEDARLAVNEAVGADGGNSENFEIIAMNLNEAVGLLSNSKESAFMFIPPTSSLKHIRDYLQG